MIQTSNSWWVNADGDIIYPSFPCTHPTLWSLPLGVICLACGEYIEEWRE